VILDALERLKETQDDLRQKILDKVRAGKVEEALKYDHILQGVIIAYDVVDKSCGEEESKST